jgi:hypothetical protein
MAYTRVSDVIQPEFFTQYVIDRTTEKSELMYAGVVENNTVLNDFVAQGGTTYTMPKWNDLSGRSQVLSENKDIEVSNITSKSEVATKLMRTKAWGSTDLAGALAGDDPMKAIGELVSNWWLRDEKYTILSVMKGIFACPDLSGLINTTNTKISGEAVLDTKQLLGDACDLLSMIYMNSAVFTELQKQNFIQYIPVAESKIQIPTYLGYRVIMDDTITKQGDNYVTYLLSKGCIQRGIGTPVGFVGTETDRDSLGNGGKDVLINRQAKILHPKGISWIGSGKIENETPTDAELEVGTNWKRVADLKKIGMAKLVHTL